MYQFKQIVISSGMGPSCQVEAVLINVIENIGCPAIFCFGQSKCDRSIADVQMLGR